LAFSARQFGWILVGDAAGEADLAEEPSCFLCGLGGCEPAELLGRPCQLIEYAAARIE
jgi:hypothetical protein